MLRREPGHSAAGDGVAQHPLRGVGAVDVEQGCAAFEVDHLHARFGTQPTGVSGGGEPVAQRGVLLAQLLAGARRTDLAGLPPTYLAAAALDLLVVEDLEYAQRLIEAGVPTEVHVAPAAVHGFDLMAPEAAVSRRFTAAKVDALRRAFREG